MNSLTFRPLSAGDARLFQELSNLYEATIPPAEQKPRETLLQMAGSPAYRFMVAMDRADVVAFSILYLAPGRQLALLEYMGVSPARQGSGVGTAMLQRAICELSPGCDLLLEVDAVEPPGPDQTQRQRRQAFYRRLGCRRVKGLSYLLPLKTRLRPPQMDLLVLSQARSHVVLSQLREWLTEIYDRVYGQSRDDPRINQMLEGLDDPIELI